MNNRSIVINLDDKQDNCPTIIMYKFVLQLEVQLVKYVLRRGVLIFIAVLQSLVLTLLVFQIRLSLYCICSHPETGKLS